LFGAVPRGDKEVCEKKQKEELMMRELGPMWSLGLRDRSEKNGRQFKLRPKRADIERSDTLF
jgi:hypothetical protein